MSEPQLCPQCGGEIPEGAPAGLCPKCLMLAGLESRPAADPGTAATQPPQSSASTGFVPPTVEEVAAKFPQLEVLELLGRGGMGAVYKARQKQLDRMVAVKILPPEISRDPAFAERFNREARAMARLSHPNIVALLEISRTADGLIYFVMEYVDGVNLRQAIQAGHMEPAQALAIVPQICEALQFAHDEGVVHRDIKPENILVDKRGRVKIADFGLAKLLGQESVDRGLTATQQVMGTLRYMAPEQMEGTKSVDHRADIYSLGVVFYELLTGELPIGRFAPPSKMVEIDVRLDEVVLRALEKKPEQRYQQASEIKTDLDAMNAKRPHEPAPVRKADGELARSARIAYFHTIVARLRRMLGSGLTWKGLAFAWTFLCTLLLVILWTPYEGSRASWSGYLDGGSWPYREFYDCAISLEPIVPTCKRIVIREKTELALSGNPNAHINSRLPDMHRTRRLTYDIEVQPLQGQARLMVVDALNGMSWTADKRSGSILDAVSLAEWLREGGVADKDIEDFQPGNKLTLEGVTLQQARDVVEIIQGASRKQYVFYYEGSREFGKRTSRLQSAADFLRFPISTFVSSPGWNATESVKAEPVVPVLYVGVPLMLAVWSGGLCLILRMRRGRSMKKKEQKVSGTD